MPSTYSTSLKIELIANGEQTGIWGQTTNNNLGTLIEQAITGVGSIDLTGLSTYTLSSYNGLADEARNAVLVFSGTPTANSVVTAPTVQKVYVVSNQVSGGYSITIKTSGGNGVSIVSGTSQLVYCDGTNFYTGVSVNSIFGNLAVSGSSSVSNATTIGGNITVNNSVISSTANISLTANSTVISMLSNTGGFVPPTGTTAQRPVSPKAGTARWNFDLGAYEIWNGLTWENITAGNYGVTYLIVAGGGGGGSNTYEGSGGAGAGGLLLSTANVAASTSYTITIGAGGAVNTQGSNSSAFGFTAIKGGAGGGTANSGQINGGSGGGQSARDNPAEDIGPGSGTAGQGYGGGIRHSYLGGGGGGAGGVGQEYGPGGIGIASSITGTSTYYAGGGGGGNREAGPGGAGGLGGGGSNGVAGTANSGGGGCGGGSDSGAYGASVGGSGVVIISYANATQRGTGGTITSYTSGATTYWVHKFTSSGTYVA